MEYKHVICTREEGLAIVTINRPDSLNALNTQVYADLYNVFESIQHDPEVRAVILTGAGEKAFVAGADIAEMLPQDSVSVPAFVEGARKASDRIYTLAKPVIAAVNGYALGGGCEIAMCCDFIIASEKAKFGQPEINLGIIPGAGGTQRLSRLIGMARAKMLVYTGDTIDANTALSMGLVVKVVPVDKLMTEAKEMARKLLSKSGVALLLAKQAMNGVEATLSAGLDLEGQCFAGCFATQDQKEGMTAFVQKRKPDFKNK